MHRNRCRALLAFILVAPLIAQGGIEETVHGCVHSARTLRVKARVDAQVSRLFVQPGDTLEALGRIAQLAAPELLGELGAREARVTAAEQRARLLAALEQQAALLETQAERRAKATHTAASIAKAQVEAQEQITRTRERLAEAERASNAEVFASRQHLLELQRAHHTTLLQEARARDEIERQKLARERAALRLVEHRALISALRGERDAMQARIDMLSVKSVLEHAYVNRVFVGPGDVVQAGVTVLAELIDSRSVRIELLLTPDQARMTGKGRTVRFVDRPHPVAGTIASLSVGNDVRSEVSAWVELPNDDGHWIPGEIVSARLEPAR